MKESLKGLELITSDFTTIKTVKFRIKNFLGPIREFQLQGKPLQNMDKQMKCQETQVISVYLE